MTDLYNGELLDMLLGTGLMKDEEIQSLSYALHKQIQIVLDMADATRTQAAIDSLPEKILDVLAVELRSPYYRQTLPVEQKREIVKRTLVWHYKAGTPGAVKELISILFGEGDIVEWFNFEEGPFTPGTFDIVTDARMTEDIAAQFLGIIQRVKNARSHLRRVLVHRDITASDSVGSNVITTPGITVTNNKADRNRGIQMMQRVAVAAIMTPDIRITNNDADIKDDFISKRESAAAGAVGSPRVVITNHRNQTEAKAGIQGYSAVGATANPGIVITNHPRDETGGAAILSATAGAVSHPHITI